MNALACLALPIESDGLNLDDVIRLLLQVPEYTGAASGVHLPDESLHLAVLPLQKEQRNRSSAGFTVSMLSCANPHKQNA